MRRVLLVSVVVAALGTAAVALAATTIVISADKSKLAFAKKALSAKAGKVNLKMPNPSVIPHDIAIRKGVGAKGKTIAKGQVVPKGGTSKLTVTLKAGKYRYFCSVPGHEPSGMWGILTVK